MKHRGCIFLLLLLACSDAEAQDTPDEPSVRTLGDYRLKAEIPIYPCHFTGAVDDTDLMVAEPASLFTVVNAAGEDSVIIRFWQWKENDVLNYRLCFADSLCSQRKYFVVARQDLSGRVSERFSRNPGFTAGTVLIPIKLRLQQFDFSKDITLGPAAGIRFRLSHFSPDYCNIIAGLGITSVTLDENSTDGYVEETTEVPALTPSLGFVFELNNAVQAGFFCGWDYVAHNENIHFVYHGKPWISIGFGYSLITLNDDNRYMKKQR